MEREPKIERWGGGEGGGKEGKETLADKGRDFEKPAGQRTGRLIGWASRTLLTCVDQRFVSY